MTTLTVDTLKTLLAEQAVIGLNELVGVAYASNIDKAVADINAFVASNTPAEKWFFRKVVGNPQGFYTALEQPLGYFMEVALERDLFKELRLSFFDMGLVMTYGLNPTNMPHAMNHQYAHRHILAYARNVITFAVIESIIADTISVAESGLFA